MNKKGFTLPEMLAVLALLAIMGVIAIATYTRVNESAKKKTLDSKVEQIRNAAIKWSKENNINNKTTISVNALVVEGYLTADENRINEIGIIENPVTGENMICNTVDITFDKGDPKAIFNEEEQNCELATQSLVDTNINIKVIDENNNNKTGSGSIAQWTNKNVIIVVSSTEYDSRATSISFDFEGNTVTKIKSGLSFYNGVSYLGKADVEKYYNVFAINASLLVSSKVIVTYNIPGELSKSRAYTIRIDKEEASASILSNSEWLTEDKPITVKVDDGKGSGSKYFYVTTDPGGSDLSDSHRYNASYEGTSNVYDIGTYYIWTEDQAGNRSKKYKMIMQVNNVDKFEPDCEVVFDGTEGDHGWYKEDPITPGGRNVKLAGISGVNLGSNMEENTPEYTAYAQYNTRNTGWGTEREDETPKTGTVYWCHVKTLAGNYGKANRTLYLDRTPPTINISVSSPNDYSKTKTVTVTIYDALSGLNSVSSIRYGFSQDASTRPSSWSTHYINAPEQTNSPVTSSFVVGSDLTGIYYLWIDINDYKDYAGNLSTLLNGGGGSVLIDALGPYKFDNTPPVCSRNNGKVNWTDGSYLITQYCTDNAGTTDQSGCSQPSWSVLYTAVQSIWSDSVVISDNVGNKRTCPYDIYLDNNRPTCGTNNGKTNWTAGSWTGNQYCVDNYSGCAQNPFSYTWTSSTRTSTITISDNLGHTLACPISVYLDTNPPACRTESTQAIGSWTNGTVTLTGYCTDTGGSGCKSPGKVSALFADEQASIQTPGSISDNAGNVTSCDGVTVRIDRTLPYCAVSKTNTGSTSGVDTHVSARDEGGSGLDTSSSQGGESGVKSNRTYTVYDYAGNIGTCGVSVEGYDCNCSYVPVSTCYDGCDSWGYCSECEEYDTGYDGASEVCINYIARNCTYSCDTCYR